MKKRSVLMLALIVLVPACGGDGEAAAPTSSSAPTAVPAETTTTTVPAPPPPDPFTIPADPAGIDAAYVEAVANELYRILGDATSRQRDGGEMIEVVETLKSVYDPSVLDQALSDEAAFIAEGFPGLKTPVGNVTITVHDVLVAEPRHCVLANVTQDVSAVVEDPPPPFTGVLAMTAKADVQPGEANQTPWMLLRLVSPNTYAGVTSCADV